MGACTEVTGLPEADDEVLMARFAAGDHSAFVVRRPMLWLSDRNTSGVWKQGTLVAPQHRLFGGSRLYRPRR